MYYHFILCPFLPAGRQGERVRRRVSGTLCNWNLVIGI